MSKIYIDDVGEGYPLVLVHGYLGSSEMWCHQRDYFSKFSRVISPALPGFGESSDAQSLDSINKMITEKKDIIGRNHNYKKVSIDKSFPNYLLDNLSNYKE